MAANKTLVFDTDTFLRVMDQATVDKHLKDHVRSSKRVMERRRAELVAAGVIKERKPTGKPPAK